MIKNFWKWYEDLKEPNKFYAAMLIMTPFFLALFSSNTIILVLGILYVGFIAATKMIHNDS